MSKLNNIIAHNKRTHDLIFKKYNLKHTEIYNEYEQGRITAIVSEIVAKSGIKFPSVLDVGAGTGNLSLKFLKYNCAVTASDVSAKSLELLKELSGDDENLHLSLIKDENLPFSDNNFDIVCAYSVLHHISDYLNTIKEMIRVVKPGGYIYIDHEANKNRYYPDENLSRYNLLTRQTIFEHLIKLLKTKELFSFNFIRGIFVKLLIDPKYQREGDIHVWKDDRVDWAKIKGMAEKNGCQFIKEVDYLMYKPKGGFKLYNDYKKKCSDAKYVIIQKNLREK